MKKKKTRFGLGISLFFTIVVLIELALALALGFGYVLSMVLEKPLNISPTEIIVVVSIVLGTVIAFAVNRLFLRPIITLSEAMEQVASGDFTLQLKTKSLVKEIRNIFDNFNLMTKELDATETLQSDFMSNVSHEIKTPITAIEGYTTLLQRTDNIDETEAAYIEKILFNTKRLSDLVGNILLLSKIDNQAIETEKTIFRLDEQIRQAIMLLEAKWNEKHLEFDAELEHVVYCGNEGLLLHVWTNLISNAIKFSPKRGLIRITLINKEHMIVITVSDPGPGILEEEKEHLFDKFYQGDSSHKQEGNGLGLALVKQIVELNQGKVFAENKEVGCEFTVILPQRVSEVNSNRIK